MLTLKLTSSQVWLLVRALSDLVSPSSEDELTHDYPDLDWPKLVADADAILGQLLHGGENS